LKVDNVSKVDNAAKMLITSAHCGALLVHRPKEMRDEHD
jgi:hypothetical protein